MSIKEAIISLNIIDVEFRAIQLADTLYPNSRYDDSEGRVYNHSVPAVARRLRHTKGIQEIRHGVFYAHREYFNLG